MPATAMSAGQRSSISEIARIALSVMKLLVQKMASGRRSDCKISIAMRQASSTSEALSATSPACAWRPDWASASRYPFTGSSIERDAIIPAIRSSRNGVVAALGTRDASLRGDGDTRVCSYEALLADPAVNALYVPLPNSMHLEWAIRAAEAGRPVLLEKPFALNADEAEKIVEAFERRHLPLMESFMYRLHPQHMRVRELIELGHDRRRCGGSTRISPSTS